MVLSALRTWGLGRAACLGWTVSVPSAAALKTTAVCGTIHFNPLQMVPQGRGSKSTNQQSLGLKFRRRGMDPDR